MTWAYAPSRPSLGSSTAGRFSAQPVPQLRRPLATRRNDSYGPPASEDEVKAARQWIEQLNPETIPRSMCDISFSRSSGPGGQNVNKVSSKATVRVPLGPLFKILPPLFHQEIRQCRYFAANSDSLILQSDEARKQNENVHACFRKLHELIVDVGKKIVPGETSAEQRERVKNLQKAANERRIRSKKLQSSKKSARKGSME
ncbi:peptidyl-tRNA hydrolase domain protein [Phyllosticta citriasiana]|uniref:Peptidyl-tRNA hydrolase domain protein n=1 Tax=Phyllosticta citriasiana TaxID=595635 RepID=A0ABR1KTP1_9PEZI